MGGWGSLIENSWSSITITAIICSIAALITISKTVRSFIYSLISSKPNISGKWLLIIYDGQKKVYKVDEYQIKQIGNKISGKIKRIYSSENTNQEFLRKYTFKGFFFNSEVFYAFKPNNIAIRSYGVCDLKMKGDLEFTGYYYVPIDKQGRRKKYDIKLTRLIKEIYEIENFNQANLAQSLLKLPVNKRLKSK
ncbi:MULTISPECIES: hypothetical protein [Flavobacteriaceae]|uniref:hypothetical protein n=1 Tax=Flavobacteriaceae TaxID=49546 RepID=UPI001492DF0F|nr:MULTISPECIES: hypothetical protein [Allomuricauda]MDC6367236.1 hypothetical protein [Muricauda sp. AC10]